MRELILKSVKIALGTIIVIFAAVNIDFEFIKLFALSYTFFFIGMTIIKYRVDMLELQMKLNDMSIDFEILKYRNRINLE